MGATFGIGTYRTYPGAGRRGQKGAGSVRKLALASAPGFYCRIDQTAR